MSKSAAVLKRKKVSTNQRVYVKLRKQDCKLLKESRVLKTMKEFEWLVTFLEDKERVTVEDLTALEKQKRLEFTQITDRLLVIAAQEWKGDDSAGGGAIDYREDPIPCSLCGRDNKHIYYIINVHEPQVRLNVGSECFGKFDFDLGMDEAQIQKSKKSAVRLQSERLINKYFPGITDLIDDLAHNPDTFQIVIPKKVREKFEKCLEELNTYYYKFLEGKRGSLKNKIRTALVDYKNEKTWLELYVKANKESDNVVTTTLAAWIKENCPFETYQRIIDEGYVTGVTSRYVHQQPYMESLVPRFNTMFTGHGVTVLFANERRKGYAVQLNGSEATYFCSHYKLIEAYGYSFYGHELDEKIDQFEVLKISYPYTSDDLEEVYSDILFRFNEIIGFNMVHYDERTNEVVLKRLGKDGPRYWFENLRDFVHKFKHLPFSKERRTYSEELHNYLKSYNGPTFDNEEMEDNCKVRGWDKSTVLK